MQMDKDKMLDQMWENLSYVIDPEVGVSIMDLNLVQKLELQDDGTVSVEVRMTTPACPAKASTLSCWTTTWRTQ